MAEKDMLKKRIDSYKFTTNEMTDAISSAAPAFKHIDYRAILLIAENVCD